MESWFNMAGTGWHDFGIPIEISILSCYPTSSSKKVSVLTMTAVTVTVTVTYCDNSVTVHESVGGFKYQLFSDVFRTVFQEVVSEKKVTFQDGLMSNFAFLSGISGCFSRWTFRGGLNFEAVNTAILTHLGLRGKF
jgi:hypothetical protein